MRFIRYASIVLVLAVGFSVLAQTAEFSSEPLAEIKTKIEQKQAVLVDVREKAEWEDGHVDGALFLPLSVLRRGLSEEDGKSLPKDKILYLHCAVGMRAMTAAKILEKLGYSVRPVKTNFEEFVGAGFPKAK